MWSGTKEGCNMAFLELWAVFKCRDCFSRLVMLPNGNNSESNERQVTIGLRSYLFNSPSPERPIAQYFLEDHFELLFLGVAVSRQKPYCFIESLCQRSLFMLRSSVAKNGSYADTNVSREVVNDIPKQDFDDLWLNSTGAWCAGGLN